MSTSRLVAPAWPARRNWQPVALGVLWGIAVTAMEAAILPASGDWLEVFRFALHIAPGWAAVGIGLAVLVELLGARTGHPAVLATGALGCALLLAALWSLIYGVAARGPVPSVAAIFPHGVDPLAAFAYQTWVVLFYGGLYYVAWRFNRRAERTRALLGEAELARVRTESSLAEAQLERLRGHLEPGLLLRVMTEVARRYARQGAGADRLLALLVAFLRCAMPAVRSGRSTLARELALARAYGELVAELDPAGVRWTIAGAASDDAPFPALLLLPLIDALARASAPAPGPCGVRVAEDADAIVVDFLGAPGRSASWLAPELDYRVRVGLSTLYGDGWTMTLREPADRVAPALTIALRWCAAADGRTARAGAALSYTTAGGVFR